MMSHNCRKFAGNFKSNGPAVRAELDENKCPEGVEVSDAGDVNLSRHAFHEKLGDLSETKSARRKRTELLWTGPMIDYNVALRNSRAIAATFAAIPVAVAEATDGLK
jgi:hypothetical protein